MAVDMRARYFGEFDEGAMPPSFSVYPQYELPNSDFMVMPPAAAQVPAQQYLPAVQPMTQEAAAPYDLSGLDLSSLAGLDLSGLYGMNFGTDFGGGAMGGIYPDDPNTEFIAAPLSNKGNATSQTGGNAFEVRVDQPVRLVDHSTNQVVFEGTGYDAARKATELGQGLSDTLGRKANYSIQTADPTGNYSTVAYEKANKSTLGEIANVAGTLLPLAMIPLTAGASAGSLLASTAGKIGLGTALGAAGAGLKGDNILKGAVMGGLSSAGGQLLGPALEAGGKFGTALAPKLATAVGTGLGSTAGGLVTGQSLKNSLLGGAASGALSYLTPDITKALSGGAPASTSTGAGGGGYDGILVSATPAVAPINLNTSLGGSPNKIQQALEPKTEVPYDGLAVTGSRLGGTFGVDLGGNQFGAPGQDQSAFEKIYTEPYVSNEILVKATPATQASSVAVPVTGGLSSDVLDGIAEFEKSPIVAEGSKIEQPTSVAVPVTGGLSSDVLDGIAEFEKSPIVAEGSKIEQATPGGFTIPQTDLEVLKKVSDMETEKKEDIVVTGTDKTTPVAVTADTDLGTKSVTDTLPKLEADPELTDKKKLSVADALALLKLADGLIGGGGGGGGGGTPGSQALNPIFSAKLPTPGEGGAFKVGGLDYTTPPARSAADMYRYAMGPAMDIRAGTDLSKATSPYAGYGPGTLGEETFKRVTGMAHGGAMGYARGSSRDSFAVEGPGTGRSDDIPAVLSDGEYVIDAETVALLGDGSSKAGAKKLDEMRVKIRKHKGRNLAKGKFSVNARRPEKYLSGGRT